MKSVLKKILRNISSMNEERIQVEGRFKVSTFRKFQNINLEKVASLSGINNVINLGATQVDGDKMGRKYKDYFREANYYTLDTNRSSDKDSRHFTMDLHDLSSLGKTFDLVLLMSTLEHVQNPFIVSEEVKKIVSPGGYLYISAPFFYPIHKDLEGRYSDYWRFTDDALRVLFKDLEEEWILPIDSVIRRVKDRNVYWENSDLSVVGYCALFKKK